MRFLLLLLFPLFCQAQTTAPVFISSPNYQFSNGTSQRAIGIIDAQIRGNGLLVSPARGYLKAGVAGSAKVDMNGIGGTAVGLYGIAEGVGRPGSLQDEVTGVYGRADKNGPFWGAGVHGECLLDASGVDSGGTCIGISAEMYGANTKSLVIGVNVQPHEGLKNVIGMQFQNAEAYQYAIKAPNMSIQFGDVDTDHFCMKFDPRTQRLEFWRACNRQWTTRVGFIDMSFNAPDVPLNR